MANPLLLTTQMMMSHDSRATRYPQRRRQSPPLLFSDIPLTAPKYTELRYEVKYAQPREEEVARVETSHTEQEGDLGGKKNKTSCCSLI